MTPARIAELARISDQTLTLVREARDGWKRRAEAAEAALEVAREELENIAADFRGARVYAREALAKLPPRRSP